MIYPSKRNKKIPKHNTTSNIQEPLQKLEDMENAKRNGKAIQGTISDGAMAFGPVGMVVGTAIKVGGAAGDLIDSHNTNEDGSDKNKVLGHFSRTLNPIASTTEIASNWGNMNEDEKTDMIKSKLTFGIAGSETSFKERMMKQYQIAKENARQKAYIDKTTKQGQAYQNQFAKANDNLMFSNVNKPMFAKRGGIFPKYLHGGAIITGGQLHKEGNKVFGKGNPVVNEQGEKVAETEVGEMLLNKEQTDELENLYAEYNKTKDKNLLIEIGNFFHTKVFPTLKDNSK